MSIATRAVEAFGAALLPTELGGPAPELFSARVLRYLDVLPPSTRSAIITGMLITALAGNGVAGASRQRDDPDRRAAALERLQSLHPQVAAGIDGLKAIALLANEGDANREEMRAPARAHRPARPDAELPHTPVDDCAAVTRADAVVVGSGAGGATAARTLAGAGMDVVIVEEGHRWGVEDFRSGHPVDRYAGLYREAGTTLAIGRPPVVLPLGRAIGGSTVVNSGTCFPTPERVQQRWFDEFGLTYCEPGRLEHHVSEVEAMLRVARPPGSTIGRNGNLLLEGADALGWRSSPLARNAPDCVGSCQCAIGCPRNAKFGVHLNALPDACASGATIISGARVETVLRRGDAAVGVRSRRSDGSAVDVLAPIVVVAAGTTETPPLLARSGLGSHPRLGRNLSIHPAVPLGGQFDEEVVPWKGILQSAVTEELHHREGILIEATATPPGMGSMSLPGFGRELLTWLDRAPHLASMGAMVADRSVGSVHRGPGHRTIVRYSIDHRDGQRLKTGIRAMAQLLFAAGARRVLTGIGSASTADSLPRLDEILSRTSPRELHLAAFHPVGTAAAGSDPQVSPVDETGRLRGVTGLWVADASILPSCPEVNPQVTIMALAQAVAERIVETGADSRG